MRMIDLSRQTGPLHMIDTATAVDCGREVRLRRSLRSLVECVVPCCCGFQASPSSDSDSLSVSAESSANCSSVVTGTFFGYRRGRVSFCLQDDTRAAPLLLLEFAVPTSYLAREMRHGLLRIALECGRRKAGEAAAAPEDEERRGRRGGDALFSEPVWSMYCNGRKVGFAVRRRMTAGDAAVLRLMRSVSVGAGVLPVAAAKSEKGDGDGDLLYLRASFERVIGSADSESFHMIDPVGSYGQELSIFLLRT